MREVLCVLVGAVVLVGGSAGPGVASVFTDALSYDGNPDVIQDNSVALALFDNGDGVVSVGDIIGGLVTWNTNISDGVHVGATSIAFFTAEVATWGLPGSGPIGGDPSIAGLNTAVSPASRATWVDQLAVAISG